LGRSTKGCCFFSKLKCFIKFYKEFYKLKVAKFYKEEVTLKNNLKIAESEFEEIKHDNEQYQRVGSLKNKKNQEFNEARMANQKVRAKIRWKQIKCFVLKEFFTIVKSKNIRIFIWNLKNKD